MKLITRNTDYAIRALCYITKQKKKFVSATEMVEALRIPRPFLRKILQVLSGKNLLKSYKGQGGGFSLSYPSEKILLTDLISIFQGSIQLNECMFKKKVCPSRRDCVLRKEVGQIEESILRRLRKISIASLVRGGKRKGRKGESW